MRIYNAPLIYINTTFNYGINVQCSSKLSFLFKLHHIVIIKY